MKTTNLTKTIICALSISLTFSAFAGNSKQGTNSGGGGGAYRTDSGKLVTLPEFGVLIEDKHDPIETTGKKYKRLPTYYTVSDSTIAQLDKIREKMSDAILGANVPWNTYAVKKNLIYKTDVDPELYQKIKVEYQAVLEAFGYKLESDRFILPAVTIDSVTYIFPEFDKLTSLQQAKYLIHEAQMRNQESSTSDLDRVKYLENVLKFDTIIEKILTTNKKKLDIFNLMKSLVSLNKLNMDHVLQNILKMMADELGRELTFNDFAPDSRYYLNIAMDPSLIQEIQITNKLKRNYAEMLEGVEIQFIERSFSWGETYEKCSSRDRNVARLVVSGNDTSSKLLRVRRCVSFNVTTHDYISLKKAGPFLEQFKEK
jgi:hypothetical protein